MGRSIASGKSIAMRYFIFLVIDRSSRSGCRNLGVRTGFHVGFFHGIHDMRNGRGRFIGSRFTFTGHLYITLFRLGVILFNSQPNADNANNDDKDKRDSLSGF